MTETRSVKSAIGYVSMLTLALYAAIVGRTVMVELGIGAMTDYSPVASPLLSETRCRIWIVDWWKLAAVSAAILGYSFGLAGWARRWRYDRSTFVVSLLMALTTTILLGLLLWPDLYSVLGDRRRASRMNQIVTSVLDALPGGLTGHVAVTLTVQGVLTALILNRAVSRR